MQNRTIGICVVCSEERAIVSRGRCMKCLQASIRAIKKESETNAGSLPLDRSQHFEHEQLAEILTMLSRTYRTFLKIQNFAVSRLVIPPELLELVMGVTGEWMDGVRAIQKLHDQNVEAEVDDVNSETEVDNVNSTKDLEPGLAPEGPPFRFRDRRYTS